MSFPVLNTIHVLPSTKYVGIGTATPSTLLHVQGTASATGTVGIGTTNSSAAQCTIESAGAVSGLILNHNGTGPVMEIKDASAVALHVAKGGNIGIATGTPGALFSVYDSGSSASILEVAKDASLTPSTAWNTTDLGILQVAAAGNGRSINAAGSINASGLDFAEYLEKEDASDIFARGEIVGINAHGRLTKLFDASIDFGIKSTNPAYVGGDAPARSSDAIAFCGQVPVNVWGAQPGDYIVPIRLSDGTICAKTMDEASIGFDDFKKAVGKVYKIMEDGRAWVRVR